MKKLIINLREKMKVNQPPNTIWTNPIHFIGCGFGVGAIPIMPGTFGTALAIPIYFILIHFSWLTYAIVTLFLILIGVGLCGRINRDFGTEDHSAAVWDEVATFLIVLFLVPPVWYYILIGFILFRLFDILKPGPIGWVDRHIHGGVGVMLDDVLAAVVSWIILQIIIWFI